MKYKFTRQLTLQAQGSTAILKSNSENNA